MTTLVKSQWRKRPPAPTSDAPDAGEDAAIGYRAYRSGPDRANRSPRVSRAGGGPAFQTPASLRTTFRSALRRRRRGRGKLTAAERERLRKDVPESRQRDQERQADIYELARAVDLAFPSDVCTTWG